LLLGGPSRLKSFAGPQRLGVPLNRMNVHLEANMGTAARRFTLGAVTLLSFSPLLLAPARASAQAGPAPAWETLRREEGILVSRREVKGSPFVAFRGEGDVDAPLLSVGSVLVDVPREREWIDSLAEARILRQVTRTEYITYTHVSTPPTMSDRDFVMDATIEADAARHALIVRMRSVDDPSAPKTKFVRGQMEDSSFVLTSIDGGKRTHVVAEVHCDPKGSIAGWIVNLFQKSWGFNTIHSLRAQVSKKDIAVSKPLEALLEEKGII
jgi:hypothetical protein